MNAIRPRRWLLIIVGVFVMLALLYSVSTPIFEASDEMSHYAVVQHIADTGELPLQQTGVKTPWEQEGSQPPLYYFLVSTLARWIDTRDAAERMIPNPHAAPGDPSLDANRNLVIHSPAEDFPWHNTTLAVHLMRFLSILMGAGTIIAGYHLARRIFPNRSSIPIGTAALIAFTPMFIFISASVNNDNLTILLASLALVLSVVCWQEPAGRVSGTGWLRRFLLGVVLGGAALSKISGLTLLPIIALMLTIRHLRQRDWKGWLLSGLLIALPVVVIAGWWYWRNLQLYGELFGLNTMVAIAGPRSLTLLQLIPEFDGFRYAYWALFGAVNIVTFPLAYVVFDVFTLLGVVGCAIWFVRSWKSDRERALLLLILLGDVLLVFIGVVRWTMMTPASQGRLMFPAVTVIALLLWLGWETIFSFQFSNLSWSQLRWAMPVFMVVTSIIVPFRDIAPAYAGPQFITESDLPADVQRLDVDYGDQLRLLGYQPSGQVSDRDLAEFTLYWQCLRPMTADYSVFAIVYGRQLQEVGKRDAFPFHGLYATRQCQPGQVFADPYRIPVNPAAERPTLLRAQIGVKDWANTVELLPSHNRQALPALVLTVGQLRPKPVTIAKPSVEGAYRLGDLAELTGYDLEIDEARRKIVYHLYWRVLNSTPVDYTWFMHLNDNQGQTVANGDSQPFNGDYPTSRWQMGEEFVEERVLPLPDKPGNYRVLAGLYQAPAGSRLPAVNAAGQRAENDEIFLGMITR